MVNGARMQNYMFMVLSSLRHKCSHEIYVKIVTENSTYKIVIVIWLIKVKHPLEVYIREFYEKIFQDGHWPHWQKKEIKAVSTPNIIGFLPKKSMKTCFSLQKTLSQEGVHFFILNLLPLYRSDSDWQSPGRLFSI